MVKRQRNNKVNKPSGNVTLYKPEYTRQVFYLCLAGFTDVQISNFFNVSLATVNTWKHTHPEFLTALRKGKERADSRVAHALYKSAIGYKFTEEHVLTNRVKKRNEKGKVVEEYTEPLIVNVKRERPPNVKAAIKWLSARQPEIWGTKLQVDGRVDVNHKLDFSDFSNEELQVLKKLGIKSQEKDNDIEDIECEQV
jgi:hypothetical protein